MNEILKQILSKLDTFEVGQQKLETEIVTIQKDTVLIPLSKQAAFESNQDNQKIKEIQETLRRHEVILGVLSTRSIEQEARLKQIV